MALVAHWALDEGTGTLAEDETGNFDGTLSEESWVVDGIRGNVFDSTATNEINCGDTTVANTMSWAFWINTDSFPAVINYILSKYVPSGTNRSYRIRVNSSGKLSIQVSSDGSNNDVTSATDANDIEIAAGWQHVIITFDAGTVTFYIDNVLLTDDGGNALTSIHDSTTDQLIGDRTPTSDAGFDGQISDVYIFDYVVTSQERADLFADTFGDPEGVTITVPTGPVR